MTLGLGVRKLNINIIILHIAHWLLNYEFLENLVTRLRGYIQIRSSAWLEHYTDNVGVTSSNLVGSTKPNWRLLLSSFYKKILSQRSPPSLTACAKAIAGKASADEGGLAQLARAPALHAGGHRFESDILHTPIDIGNWQL